MKTRKLISILICVLLSALSLTTAAFAESAPITYELTEFGYAQAVSCDKQAAGTVTVDASVVIDGEEYAVKQIGERCFSGCTEIEKIVLPEGITSIRGRAFENCTGLKSVDVPKSLIACQYDAFEGCGTVTVNCYRSNYQFFTVYGFSDNIEVNVLDDVIESPEAQQAAKSLWQIIKDLFIKFLALFGITI